MLSWLKSLMKDSMVYGVGFGVSRFLQIIVLPIIAHSLSVAEFGYYSNYVIFYTIAGGFFILGLDSSVARFYYDSEDERYHKMVLSSAFFTVLLTSLVAAVIFNFFPVTLLSFIGVPQTYKGALFYVVFTIPAIVLNNFFLSWFKWKRQKFFFLANSIGNVVMLLLPLLLIHSLTFQVLFKVIFFGQLTIAFFSTLLAARYIRFTASRSLLKAMLKYGFPWMLVFVLGISRSYLDRFFLMRYLDENNYGIYNFSVRISTFLSLIITAFDMSFGPLAFSIWNKPNASQFFARLQSIYTFLISAAACSITIISPQLIQLLGGTKYQGAEKVLPVLLFSAIPLSLINFSSLGTTYAKKSFLSTATLLIGFTAVLLLNFILTPVYLQYGAVSASLIGHLLILGSGYYFSRKYYTIHFHYGRDGAVFLVFLVLSVLSVQVSLTSHPIEDVIIKLLGLMAIATIVFLVFFQKEYKKSLSYLKNLRYARIRSHAGV